MSVYVDSAFIKYRSMHMCHMIADSVDELHAMARRLDLRKDWFQDGIMPYYDISRRKREKALELGAKVVNTKELVKIVKAQRELK